MKFSNEWSIWFSIIRNTMSKHHLDLFIGIPDADHEGYGIVIDRPQAGLLRDYLNKFLKDDTTDTTMEALLERLAEQEGELIRFRREESIYGQSRDLINECAAHLRNRDAAATAAQKS